MDTESVAADYEIVPCICGSSDDEQVLRARDYLTGQWQRLVRCRRCHLVYVNPRPTKVALPAYYPGTHAASPPAFYERSDAAGRIKRLLKLRPIPGRILDVGCGKGLVLSGLAERGWSVVGTELDENSSQYARSQWVEVLRKELPDCELPAASFDVVTLFHSLEHMGNPARTLQAAVRLLKPEGLLVVEVPHYGSWMARTFGAAWFHLDVPRHLFHFEKEQLGELLRQSGLRLEVQRTHDLMYDAFGVLQSALNWLFPRDFNLLNRLQTKEVTWAGLVRAPQRARRLAVAMASVVAQALFFPLLLVALWLSARRVPGGTLRLVARRVTTPQELHLPPGLTPNNWSPAMTLVALSTGAAPAPERKAAPASS